MTGTLAPTTLSDTDWSQDPRFDTVIHRRKTRSVRVATSGSAVSTRWWCNR